jgi:hypothetical protein
MFDPAERDNGSNSNRFMRLNVTPSTQTIKSTMMHSHKFVVLGESIGLHRKPSGAIHV